MDAKAYPVIMEKGEKFIIVFIPDFNIDTQGVDYAEAIEMAADAIGVQGICLEDAGLPIPEPSKYDDISVSGNEIKNLVVVDFKEYRRKIDLTSIRTNVTLPGWLDYEAEKAKLNKSRLLQEAIIQRLNLQDRSIYLYDLKKTIDQNNSSFV